MNKKPGTTKVAGILRYPLYIFNLLQKYQEEVFLFFVGMMVISLPTSRFGLSFAQFGLLGIWIIGGNLKQKFLTFFKSRSAIVLVLIYLMHVAGLMFTSDFTYAFKDLRIKLPLLWLPVLFVSVNFISPRRMKIILQIYIGAIVVSTLYSLRINLFQNVATYFPHKVKS